MIESLFEDRHLSKTLIKTIQSRLFCSAIIHDQITATWHINSSRRWWSSKFWRTDGKVQGKVRWHCAMDSQCLSKFPGKRRRKEEHISILLLNSCTSEQFRDIQEVIFVIHYCKTMYCCRMTLQEYIYHNQNAFEMHSIIKSGLIPGGKSLRRDRQPVFFTAVSPMDARQDLKEVECDLDRPSIAPYKHTWKAHHNTVHWCNLKLVHAVTLSSTLPAICTEKVAEWKLLKRTSVYPGYVVLHLSRTRPSQIRENVMIERAKSTSTGSSREDFRILCIPLLNRLKQIAKKELDD